MFKFNKRTITTANEFWKWFSKHENEYYELEGDIEGKFKNLEKYLTQIHSDLSFEFSADLIDGKREFIISADGFKDAFPYVINIVDSSPLNTSKWELIAFKQRNGMNEIEYEGVILKPENLSFSYELVERKGKKEIDIDVYVTELELSDETVGAIFIFLDNLIGEYDVATKIRNIDFHEIKTSSSNLIAIKELVGILDSL